MIKTRYSVSLRWYSQIFHTGVEGVFSNLKSNKKLLDEYMSRHY